MIDFDISKGVYLILRSLQESFDGNTSVVVQFEVGEADVFLRRHHLMRARGSVKQ